MRVPNVKLFRKIIRYWEQNALRLDMGCWLTHLDDMTKKELKAGGLPECGTVGCLSGTAILLSGGKWFPTRDLYGNRVRFNGKRVFGEAWSLLGAKLLGVPKEEADSLFLVEEWPQKFKEQYRLAEQSPTKKAAKRLAATKARIKEYLEGKGVSL